MAEQTLIVEAANEVERRSEVRRGSDRWLYGIMAALIVSIFVGGVAWGSTRAEISQKVDKADFASFTSGYAKDRATDSLSNKYRDSTTARIERKLDVVLCKQYGVGCQP